MSNLHPSGKLSVGSGVAEWKVIGEHQGLGKRKLQCCVRPLAEVNSNNQRVERTLKGYQFLCHLPSTASSGSTHP